MGYSLSYEWNKQRNSDRYIHSKYRDFPEDSKADLQCDWTAQPRGSDHTTGNCTSSFGNSYIVHERSRRRRDENRGCDF